MSESKKRNQSFKGKRNKRSKNSSAAQGSNMDLRTTAEIRPNVVTEGGNNDPSWYTHIYAVADNIAKVPFNYPSGITFNPIDNAEPENQTVKYSASNFSMSFPGICVFNIMPTIGPTTVSSDAANVAMQQLYAIDRAANSGAKNYDAPDLMLLVMGMSSAYMLYSELVRAYRVYSSYDPMNRYQPNGILQALGFDPALEQDRANFKAMLDLFAYRLASINIPDQFDFIKRYTWLYSNVYTDSDSTKSQFYAYVPDGYYVWTEGVEGKPTYLHYTKRKDIYGYADDKVTSIDQISKAINTLLDPLLGSQDVGLISGDLAKAFGESGMIKIQPVSDLDAFAPVRSEEVLLQMMNATIFSSDVVAHYDQASNIAYSGITVDYSNTATGPILKQTVTMGVNEHNKLVPVVKHLFNMINTEPTSDNVLVGSRLMANCQQISDIYASVTNSGTEIVTRAFVYYNNGNAELNNLEVFQNHVFDVQNPGSSNDALVNFYETALLLSKFDYAPTLYLFTPESETAILFDGVMQDVCNYTWLDDQSLKRLNDVCLMSEFYVKDYKTSLTK
nr:putative capsid [Marmot picobirnavirus]